MSEDVSVETSTDLIDVDSHLFYVYIGCCKFIHLHLVLQDVRLDRFVLT